MPFFKHETLNNFPFQGQVVHYIQSKHRVPFRVGVQHRVGLHRNYISRGTYGWICYGTPSLPCKLYIPGVHMLWNTPVIHMGIYAMEYIMGGYAMEYNMETYRWI